MPLPLLPTLKGCFYDWLPLKGSSYSFTLNLSSAISCFSCSSIYFFIVASFSPTVLTYYPTDQKCLLPNLYFKFAWRSNIISALFPFRYPMKLDTLIFGGILTSIWTWSGIRCPSITSTPLYPHSSLRISPIDLRYWLYIIFRLYLGVNTMWYLHIHFVCDKLLCLFAMNTFPFCIVAWTSLSYSERCFFV